MGESTLHGVASAENRERYLREHELWQQDNHGRGENNDETGQLRAAEAAVVARARWTTITANTLMLTRTFGSSAHGAILSACLCLSNEQLSERQPKEPLIKQQERDTHKRTASSTPALKARCPVFNSLSFFVIHGMRNILNVIILHYKTARSEACLYINNHTEKSL